MLAALHGRSLLQGDDRQAVALGALAMHFAVVVALVHRGGRGQRSAPLGDVQQHRGELALMLAGALDMPRDRQAGFRAGGEMEAVAVEAAAFANGDRRAVTPRRVGIAVALTFRPIL